MINKYTKKPVEIESVKFEYTPECIDFLKSWLGKEFKSYGKNRHPNAIGWIEIGTLEDGDGQVKHIASEGDYIIKGIQGEFYPCKPDIFDLTYNRSPTQPSPLQPLTIPIDAIIDREFVKWADKGEQWESQDVKDFSHIIACMTVGQILTILEKNQEECEFFDDWDRGYNCGIGTMMDLIRDVFHTC